MAVAIFKIRQSDSCYFWNKAINLPYSHTNHRIYPSLAIDITPPNSILDGWSRSKN